MATTAQAERINNAYCELKLAQNDGSADWISKAARALDEALDELSRDNS